MKVIRFSPDEHYELIADWFSRQGWEVPPVKNILPKDSGFLIRADDGRLLACTFIYISNSPLCWQEWTAVNPDARPREKLLSVRKLIEYTQWFVKELNPASRVLTLLSTRSLEKLFQRCGFQITEKASLVTWGG